MLFKKRLDIRDFATTLSEAHKTFFSEQVLTRMIESLKIVTAADQLSSAKLEWTLFGIYAVKKGIEGNTPDATVRYCSFTAFLADMHSQIEAEAILAHQDLDIGSATTERLEQYETAWHRFPDSRAVQELGETVSKRVLNLKMGDQLVALPFGQLAVANMIDIAKFIREVLAVVKLRI